MNQADIIPVPYHIFEPQLTAEARRMRTKVINANSNRKVVPDANSIVQEKDIEFKCSHLKTRVVLPARTKDCEHESVVDLTLLIYYVFIEKRPQACPTCKKVFNNWETDIVIDPIIKKILNEIRPDCIMVKYNLKKNKYYLIDSKDPDITSKMIKIIDENEKYNITLEDIIKRVPGLKIINPTISLICAFSGKRMNYPCRFKDCNHLECIDLEELAIHCQNEIYWNCPICPAKTKSPLTEIEIDKSILPICLKNDKTLIDFIYNTTKKTHYFTNKKEDLFLKGLEGDQTKSLEEKLTLINDALKQIILFNTTFPEGSVNPLEAYFQANPDQEEIKINLIDKEANSLIEFPARTRNCEHLETFDVRTYLKCWGQGNSTCPKCQEPFDDPKDDIYIDNHMNKATILNTEEVIYLFKKKIFIPSQGIPTSILIKIIDVGIDYDAERYKNKTKLTFNLNCLLSQKRMNKPITMKECKHPACFDLIEYGNFNERPEKCPYPKCGLILIPHQLVIDLVVQNILALEPKEDFCNYNLISKRIEQKENLESVIIFESENKSSPKITRSNTMLITNNTHFLNIQKNQNNNNHSSNPIHLKPLEAKKEFYQNFDLDPKSYKPTKPIIIQDFVNQRNQSGSISEIKFSFPDSKPKEEQTTSFIILPSAYNNSGSGIFDNNKGAESSIYQPRPRSSTNSIKLISIKKQL